MRSSMAIGRGSLLAFRSIFHWVKRKDLKLTDECVWVEVKLGGRASLVVSNHNFQSNFPPQRLNAYLGMLKGKLNIAGVRIVTREF